MVPRPQQLAFMLLQPIPRPTHGVSSDMIDFWTSAGGVYKECRRISDRSKMMNKTRVVDGNYLIVMISYILKVYGKETIN